MVRRTRPTFAGPCGVLLALLALALAGCGEQDRAAGAGELTSSPVLAVPAIEVGNPPARRCRTEIQFGYRYSGTDPVRAVTCVTAVRVLVALAKAVRRRQDAGEDCYPGFCPVDTISVEGFAAR